MSLFVNTGRVAFALGSFLTSPIVIATAALAALLVLVEVATPTVNILGGALSAIAAPLGFLAGVIKGFAIGFKEAFLPMLPQVQAAISPLLGFGTYLTESLNKAIAAFKLFFGTGENLGKNFGASLATSIVNPILQINRTLNDSTSQVRRAWDYTIGYISNLLTPFVQFVDKIGYDIVGALAEHSPGANLADPEEVGYDRSVCRSQT